MNARVLIIQRASSSADKNLLEPGGRVRHVDSPKALDQPDGIILAQRGLNTPMVLSPQRVQSTLRFE